MILSFFRVHCGYDSEIRDFYILKGGYFNAAKKQFNKDINFFQFDILFQEMQI
jgi:uncharacterized membrane protein (UPF0182 family)